jgi:DNA polymerase-3 subunit delta
MPNNSSVYLLLGPEIGEKEKYIEKIYAALEKEKGRKPEVFKFFPYDTNIGDVIALLRNGMLFSDHKVVVLENIDDFKSGDLKEISEYLGNPSAVSTLILCSDQVKIRDNRLEKIIPAANQKIFWEMFENQKKGWIVNYFKKYGIGLEDEAAQFIVEMVENNTKDLQSECERLALFFPKNSVIKYSDIENFIYHSKEENVFTLADSIMGRDFPGAVEILQKILLSREEDPVRIINGILWQVRLLLSYENLLDEGYHADEVFSRLKIKGKRRQKVLVQGKGNYAKKELEQIIMLTAQFEVLLKSMNVELHSLLLEYFLYLIIVRADKSTVALSF